MPNTKAVINCTVDELVAAFIAAEQAAHTPPPGQPKLKLSPNQELIANGTVIVTHGPMVTTYTDLDGNAVPNPNMPPSVASAAPEVVSPWIPGTNLYTAVSPWQLANMPISLRSTYTDLSAEQLNVLVQGYGFEMFPAPDYLKKSSARVRVILGL